VAQLYADGFEALDPRQRVLVWHLAEAALWGRDIYYDQRYRHALEMREVLEHMLRHPSGIDPEVLAEITRYTKLFWINSGPHNNLTARKFVLRLSPEQLRRAAEATQAHAPPADGGSLVAAVDRLLAAFLDPDDDPVVTNKNPPGAGDLLADSANNLYEGVTERDLEGFAERHPVNSRLVKRGGALVEEVYSLGGRYGAYIARIVGHLEAALPLATPAMQRALTALIGWYRTGEEGARRAYDIAWVADRDSPVDTINGFIETYMDARGHKGAWEGLVYYVNVHKTEALQRLAAHAQWFEDHMPWSEAYRRREVQGMTARAIDVVIETGDSGPLTPIGINLPNDQAIREVYGSKSVSLTNVLEAYDKSMSHDYRVEFSWSPEETTRAERWSSAASELSTHLHEVIGHGSGLVEERLQGSPQRFLREYYSALEETRADLVALYFIADPKMIELDLVPAADLDAVTLAAYEAYARNALLQLRRVREGDRLEEDHMRNRQTIVHWLIARSAGIEVRHREARTFYVVTDVAAVRAGVGVLLADVQRIKAQGDYTAARTLFEEHGIRFDPALRDEVVRRVERLRLPSYTGFVMPDLRPIRDGDGTVIDVEISYPCDFTVQMMRYSSEYCLRPVPMVGPPGDSLGPEPRGRPQQ
jgi:dipeptidyl-peptidase-3